MIIVKPTFLPDNTKKMYQYNLVTIYSIKKHHLIYKKIVKIDIFNVFLDYSQKDNVSKIIKIPFYR